MSDGEALELLQGQHVGVLATVGTDGPQACTIFYVVESPWRVLFKSRSGSDHMVSLMREPAAALALYRHDSTYKTKAGLQVKGFVERITDETAMQRGVDLYSAAFAGAREKFANVKELIQPNAESTLYRFVTTSYKVTNGWSDRTDLTYNELS